MHDVKCQLVDSFCEALLLLFSHVLAEIGTASFIFEMKVLRAGMTWCKTVSCLNVYFPCSSDTLQAPKICAAVHTCLMPQVHVVSVVILHLLRLVGDGSVSYVEARQKEVRSDGIAIKETEKSLAQHSSSILSTGPEPAVGQLSRSHKSHRLFCSGLKYISSNVLKICY